MTADLQHSIKNVLRDSHPGKSYAQMAREMGVSPLTLQKATRGATTPRHSTLQRIASYCGVGTDVILTGYGSMPARRDKKEKKDEKTATVAVGDAYRRGFADGFADGYQRALADAQGGFAARVADPSLN